jgi:putative oxidoreductase
MASTSVTDFERVRGGRYEPVKAHRPLLDRVVETDEKLAPAIARLALGLVMFAHGAQMMFGWFGGLGLSQTVSALTSTGIPSVVAALVIFVEFFASIALIVGALSRLAALGIATIAVGAIVLVHSKAGFFMNWMGTKQGEGSEYHLLAIALALVVFFAGGGVASVDRMLTKKRAEQPRVSR